ncbi:MAG: nucleotidyltransferase [Deferrisomatales bacterium]|nr:nucleotidyltransferase [Deferrisomatales bacterium]
MVITTTNDLLRKAQLAGMLERICQELELTETQFTTAKARYETVGQWLADAENPLLRASEVYPQGSMALGTTVKPLDADHDVDLVCHVPWLSHQAAPSYLKQLIGDRLRANGRYTDILEEKPRCWRINYANEFHLDITPSIPNPACSNGGELVPDRKLREWKGSNPKGYRAWFEDCAKEEPRLRLMKAQFAATRAQIESLPEPTHLRGVLRRCVQLCKRHRDLSFTNGTAELAPISIIITTLAAKSYAYCISQSEYDTELDVLLDVVRHMPLFIQTAPSGGETHYFIWNETTQGENFAEKWNTDPRRARAFYEWQRGAVTALEESEALLGLDRLAKSLGASFGEGVVNKALAGLTAAVSEARGGRLTVAPSFGLGFAAPLGTEVRPNTFFGA